MRQTETAGLTVDGCRLWNYFSPRVSLRHVLPPSSRLRSGPAFRAITNRESRFPGRVLFLTAKNAKQVNQKPRNPVSRSLRPSRLFELGHRRFLLRNSFRARFLHTSFSHGWISFL
jgi:hypothetical protein